MELDEAFKNTSLWVVTLCGKTLPREWLKNPGK